MRQLTFANKITLVRILFVPFFICAILYYSPQKEYLRLVALSIFSLAVITDVIDGYIARTRHQKTQAGAILDPLADKILLISAFLSLYLTRDVFGSVQFPLWLVLGVISRDVILLLGSMIIFMVTGALEVDATRWGKTTTFFQILCVFGILIQWPYSPLLWWGAIVFTLISGVGYIRIGIKELNAANYQKSC